MSNKFKAELQSFDDVKKAKLRKAFFKDPSKNPTSGATIGYGKVTYKVLVEVLGNPETADESDDSSKKSKKSKKDESEEEPAKKSKKSKKDDEEESDKKSKKSKKDESEEEPVKKSKKSKKEEVTEEPAKKSKKSKKEESEEEPAKKSKKSKKDDGEEEPAKKSKKSKVDESEDDKPTKSKKSKKDDSESEPAKKSDENKEEEPVNKNKKSDSVEPAKKSKKSKKVEESGEGDDVNRAYYMTLSIDQLKKIVSKDTSVETICHTGFWQERFDNEQLPIMSTKSKFNDWIKEYEKVFNAKIEAEKLIKVNECLSPKNLWFEFNLDNASILSGMIEAEGKGLCRLQIIRESKRCSISYEEEGRDDAETLIENEVKFKEIITLLTKVCYLQNKLEIPIKNGMDTISRQDLTEDHLAYKLYKVLDCNLNVLLA